MLQVTEARQRLAYHRHPATAANRARNLLGGADRRTGWVPARDALWALLDPLIGDGARVAILGAGNAHDLPLARLARRAGELALIDLDGEATKRARRRLPLIARRRVSVIAHDVTGGAADAIVRAACLGLVPVPPAVPEGPLPGAPYDLIIGDLLYSQLLYPGLVDCEVPARLRAAVSAHCCPALVDGVVARLHASGPSGAVIHLHDALGWWPGHDQARSARYLAELGHRDLAAALAMVASGAGPHESDPRRALGKRGMPIDDTRLWVWPFGERLEYLVCATVTVAWRRRVRRRSGCAR